MTKIDELENKIFDACATIKKLKQEIAASIPHLSDAYLDKMGLTKNASIVEHRGDEYLVSGVHCTETGVYSKGIWLEGYKIKKDGTPGSRLTTIYDGWSIKKK